MPITDQFGTDDSRLANMSFGIGTTFSNQVFDREVNHTLTLSHTVELGLLVDGENTLTLSHTVGLDVTYNRSVNHTLVLSQSVAREVDYTRSVTSTLSLTQQVSVIKSPYFLFPSSTLTLTQDVDGIVVKPADNELDLTQEATVTVSFYRSVHQTLTISQTVEVLSSRLITAHSYLGMSQHARGVRTLTREIDQTVFLVQELWRDQTLEDSPHSLILSHTVVGTRLLQRSASSALTLTHSVSVSKTMNFDIVHNLVFKHSHIRPGGFPINDAFVVKVEPLTILESGNSAIVLPRPEFNDARSKPSKLNIKRAMDGTRRIYKRITISDILSYSFIIDRRKFYELRTFILNHNSDVIRLQNFKGEVWNVQFVTNPFNFVEEAYWGVQPGGNKCSITLDFEGVKVN